MATRSWPPPIPPPPAPPPPARGTAVARSARTANPALTSVPLGHLTRLTGALTVSGNAALATIDLGKLATTGHVEIADNAKLTALTGSAATTIGGNAALTNLAAFTTSLKFIDLALTVNQNPKLTDLGALKHLQLVGGISI